MATTTLSAPMSAPRSISPWLLAATVPLASFMEFLDTTIVNVAVEHIAGDLSSTIDESTYVLTSYLVANVIVLPLSGYLSGLLGRKNYYLWSVAIFTIASLLCGFAPSLYWLVFFRVLQGLGGGGLQPVSQAIIMDAFPPEKRSTAQAVFSITAVIAPAIGPLLGGWITDNYSWRWIFFINIPIGVLAFILNSRFIQDPSYLARFSFRERKFDYQGLGFLAVGLGSLQFVLDRGQIDDWFGSHAITTFFILSVLSQCLHLVGTAPRTSCGRSSGAEEYQFLALHSDDVRYWGHLLCGHLSDTALRSGDAGVDCHYGRSMPVTLCPRIHRDDAHHALAHPNDYAAIHDLRRVHGAWPFMHLDGGVGSTDPVLARTGKSDS
jgi:multidrug resistance protein